MTSSPAPIPLDDALPHRDPDGERRHLTVMFCDIISSTQIATRIDPEDYATVLRAFQASCAEVVEALGGYIARFQGDGIMVYFGFPVAHENDAARSVEAGLALARSTDSLNEGLRRHGQPELAVRIGIHTGVAVVTDMGAGSRREPDDVVGETPAIAARLQALGGPNQIVVSEATRRLTGERFQMSELGERILTGVVDPVRAFTVVGELPAADAHRLNGDLVGRQPETVQLAKLLDGLLVGSAASVVISGVAGVGKSRLVDEMRTFPAGSAIRSIEFRCGEERRLTPLGAVLPVLGALATPATADGPDLKYIDSVLAATTRDPSDRTVFASVIASLVAPDSSEVRVPLAFPERDASRKPEAVAAFLEGQAAIQPTLLVFEDLHWADPTTLDTVTRLLSSSCPTLMVVGTARPMPDLTWIPPQVPVISVNRLSDADIRKVIAGVCPLGNLADEELQELVRRADGIPLFARELALAATSGAHGTRPSRTRGRDPGVPDSLLDPLTARLDRLGTAKHVAQLASVIGRQFDQAWLLDLTPIEPNALQHDLAQLANAGILDRVEGPDGPYRFAHELLREAAYDSLLRSRRRALHERIAAAAVERPDVQLEWVAHHYALAGRPKDAIRYRRKASGRAIEMLAYREGAGHLREALRLVEQLEPADQDRIEVDSRLGLVAALMMTDGHGAPEIGDNLSRCRELADKDDVRLSDIVCHVLSVVYAQARGDHAASITLSELLVEMANRRGDRSLLLAAHHLLGSSMFWAGRFEDALAAFSIAKPLFGEAGVEIRGFNQYGDVRAGLLSLEALALWAVGRPASAGEASAELFELLGKLNHPYNDAMGQVTTAILYQWAERPADVLQAARRARELALEHEYGFWLPWAMALEGWALAQDGKAAPGIDMLRAALDRMEATGVHQLRPFTLGLLAESLLLAGNTNDALVILEQALETSIRPAVGFARSGLLYLRAQCFVATAGGAQRARLAFLEAAEAARAGGALNFELRAMRALENLGRESIEDEIARLLMRSEELQ